MEDWTKRDGYGECPGYLRSPKWHQQQQADATKASGRVRTSSPSPHMYIRRFYGLLVRVGIVSPGSIHVLAAHAATLGSNSYLGPGWALV